MKVKALLNKFSEKEILEISTLLEIGLLGNQKSLFELFNACSVLQRKSKEWEERELSEYLYPDKKYEKNRNYLRTRLSKLYPFLLKYLSLKALIQDATISDYCLLKELNRRNWKHVFNHQYPKVRNRIKNNPFKGFDQYNGLLHIEEEKFYWLHINETQPYQEKAMYQEAIESLDRAYVLRKLSLANKALEQDRILAKKHEIPFLDDVRKWVTDSDLGKEKLISMYFHLNGIFSKESDLANISYAKAKNVFFNFLPWMQREKMDLEIEEIYTSLINYCVLQYNQKNIHFGDELVKLYEKMLDFGIFIKDGVIEAHNFKNIFFLYVFLKQFEAVEGLFHTFKGRIGGPNGDSSFYLCRAYYAFVNQLHEEANDLLSKAIVYLPIRIDSQLEIEILALKCRANYMLNNYGQVELEARTILRLLKSSSNTEEKKESSFRIFAKLLLHLCRLSKKSQLSKSEFEKLANGIIEEERPFYASRWVSNQMSSLSKKVVAP